jgi:probable H4MPT-linked C1 transfer pathway protein
VLERQGVGESGRDRSCVGWDIGGAHVKAALLRHGEVVDAMQWPCLLWQGTAQLDRVLVAAFERWPDLADCDHAVTMTGEMVDHFANREDGINRIAAILAAALPAPRFFAGDSGWCGAASAATHWRQIASANWLATASHAAAALEGEQGLLIDIGSTTTDLIAFRAGRVLTESRSDSQRLSRGELVYQGVVRTPLCALAQRIAWRGVPHNVMNEFFSTSADVYRITGELDPAHDQQASADNAAKDLQHSCERLARMIGLDRDDGSDADWLAFARVWREQQVVELRGQLERVAAANGLGADSVAVATGCGAFLVGEILPPGWRRLGYSESVVSPAAGAAAKLAAWVDVAAPAVAVAALAQRETR